MKILLYGMQSSGASTLAFVLAQKPDSVAFVDIWNNFAAPLLETDIDTVAKVVATTAYPLHQHVARFKPDVTVAVLRHPVDNYNSLLTKSYINESGLINEKFREMEATLAAATCFDHVVFYEDLVFTPGIVIDFFNALGWRLGCDALSFPRAEASIRAFNDTAFPWLAGRLRYGLGNFYEGMLRRDLIRFASASGASAHLPRMCPTFFAQYEWAKAQRGSSWHVPETPLLACDIGSLVSRLAVQDTLSPDMARCGYVIELAGAPGACTVSERRISLGAFSGDPPTCLRISGLPGAPFSRITARVWLENPCGPGMRIEFRINGAQSSMIGESSLALSGGAMAYIDMPFEPQAGAVSLSITALPDPKASDDQRVCIEALQLADGF